MPEPGKEETVRIVALDRNFHVTCYKCEVRFLARAGHKCDLTVFKLDCDVTPACNYVHALVSNLAGLSVIQAGASITIFCVFVDFRKPFVRFGLFDLTKFWGASTG